jgi:hypothetical protein
MNRSGISLTAKVVIAIAVFPILLGCFSLDFSPDGKRLVFLWANSGPNAKITIAASNADGSSLRLLPSSSEAMFGRWAPDSNRISYATDKGLRVYDFTTGDSRLVFSGSVGESAWLSDTEVAFHCSEKSGSEQIDKIAWLDLKTGSIRQSAELSGTRVLVRDIVPISRTDGVLFWCDQDLYLAEFGESKKITTSADVVGFAVDPASNKAVFARKSKNAKYILLSLYEYDLRLRSVTKLPFPFIVKGVNSTPRKGPLDVSYVKFSADFEHILVFVVNEFSDKTQFKVFQELYWVDRSGAAGKRLVAVDPANSGEGIMAAIAPDSKSICALYSTKDAITLARYPVDGGPKQILQRAGATKPK